MSDDTHRFTTSPKMLSGEGEVQWGEDGWEDEVDTTENVEFEGGGIRPRQAFSGWSYRREVTVTEQSGSDLTEFQVRVTFDASNFDFLKAQSDGADLRFADLDDQGLPHHVESWDASGESGTAWVRVPSVPASGETTIRVYYGNGDATDDSRPEETFAFFDEFATGFDTSVWSDVGTGAGSVSVTDGVLTVENTEDDGKSNTNNRGTQTDNFQCSLGHTIEARSRSPSGRHNTFVGFADDAIGFPHGSGVPSGGAYARLDTSPTSINLSVDDGTDYAATGNEDGEPSNYSVWRVDRISGTEIELLRDGAVIRSLTDSAVPDQDAPLYFGSDGYTAATIEVDWVRVRAYADPHPASTVGSEESV